MKHTKVESRQESHTAAYLYCIQSVMNNKNNKKILITIEAVNEAVSEAKWEHLFLIQALVSLTQRAGCSGYVLILQFICDATREQPSGRRSGDKSDQNHFN